jgi:hypothetical protein
MVSVNSSTGEASAKGSNFIGLLRALEDLRGTENARRCVAAVSPHVEGLAYGQVVAVGWYPIAWYVALHAAIAETLGTGPELARQLGRAATLRDFTTIHRLVISLLSAETVAGHAPRLMALYFRGGTAQRVRVETGSARVRFDGWKGFSPLVWEDIMGGMEAVLTVVKARNPKARALGPLDAESVEIEVRWE